MFSLKTDLQIRIALAARVALCRRRMENDPEYWTEQYNDAREAERHYDAFSKANILTMTPRLWV
jgi:hypothetical protein